MNIGIIGTGRHGSRYAGHVVHDCPGLRLRAIARRSTVGKEQARAWDCRWFADWRDLVRWREVDAVICAVPPVHNREIAAACAAHGKPLLLEKPLAIDAAGGSELVRVMATHQVPLTVCQTLRYNPVIRRLRDELPHLGQLRTIYANQRLEPSSLGWLDDRAEAGAGVTLHIAVHVFDALHFITGLRAIAVSAMCRNVQTGHLEDLSHIRVAMESGVAALVDISKLSSARSGRYEFVCTEGQLHGDQVYGLVERLDNTGKEQLAAYPATPTIIPLLQDWQRFLAGDGDNPVSGTDGLYAVRVAEACLRSAARGVEVAIAASDPH